jgi:hypothetical protein
MKDVGKMYGLLVYFTAILYILWPFYIFYGHFVYFFRFGMLQYKRSGKFQKTVMLSLEANIKVCLHQGDQIGRIFAQRTIVYFGQFFYKITICSRTHCGATFSPSLD